MRTSASSSPRGDGVGDGAEVRAFAGAEDAELQHVAISRWCAVVDLPGTSGRMRISAPASCSAAALAGVEASDRVIAALRINLRADGADEIRHALGVEDGDEIHARERGEHLGAVAPRN